jgi:hypothetical protein
MQRSDESQRICSVEAMAITALASWVQQASCSDSETQFHVLEAEE